MKKEDHPYISKWKNFETELKKISGVVSDATQFKDILDKAKQNSPLIKYKEGLIWDLYGLRNVFAHADREKYIAEVNKLAHEEIDGLIEMISNPPTVGQKFKKEVYWALEDEITEVVIKAMRKNLYTHVPVYKKNQNGHEFTGVFSESTILYWLADNIQEGKADFYKQQMKDINPKYLNDPNDLYKFVSPDKDIFTVYDEFKKAIGGKKRLGAIFVTPSGKKNELPVGIITAWDLPEIESILADL